MSSSGKRLTRWFREMQYISDEEREQSVYDQKHRESQVGHMWCRRFQL
jgi:hypothetical protein